MWSHKAFLRPNFDVELVFQGCTCFFHRVIAFLLGFCKKIQNFRYFASFSCKTSSNANFNMVENTSKNYSWRNKASLRPIFGIELVFQGCRCFSQRITTFFLGFCKKVQNSPFLLHFHAKTTSHANFIMVENTPTNYLGCQAACLTPISAVELVFYGLKYSFARFLTCFVGFSKQ